MRVWIVSLRPDLLEYENREGAMGKPVPACIVPAVFAVHAHALEYTKTAGYNQYQPSAFVVTEGEAMAYDMNPPQAFKQAYDASNEQYRRDHFPPSGDPAQLDLFPDLYPDP